MSKLAVVALLGMLALAAALDAEPQGKKTYKSYDEEEKHYEKSYKSVTVYNSKSNVKASHQEWDLLEEDPLIHPCDEQYEILGSTVSYRTTLINKKNDVAMPVGSVAWTGIVFDHERCHDCVHDKPGAYHDVKVNYQVIFEFTAEHKGQLIAAAMSDSVFSDEKTVLSVTGGSGAFEGAWGTITWVGGPKGKYAFDVYFPKVVEVTKHDLLEKEKKEGDKPHEEEEEPEERKYYRY